MPTLRPISAADLLQVLQAVGTDNLSFAARSLGYAPTDAKPDKAVQQHGPPPDDGHRFEEKSTAESVTRPTQFQFPSRPPAQFLWQASQVASLQPTGIVPATGQPVSDNELHQLDPTRKLRQVLPVSWRRSVPFLRRRGGRLVAGQVIDLRGLLRLAATGTVIPRIPRIRRLVWAAPVVVLWDDSADMQVFGADVKELIQRFQREAGCHAVRLIRLLSVDQALNLPVPSPVLLISTLGLVHQQPFLSQQWLRLARTLQQQGHILTTLAPLPPALLGAEVAVAWNAVSWDLGQRFPRQLRKGRIPAAAEQAVAASQPAAEILLDLLATAARIDQALLRKTRVRLRQDDQSADALVEYLAWHHPDCWRSIACCGLKAGEPYERRLLNRARLQKANPELVRDVQALIDQQHSAYSCALQLETELRSWNERDLQQQAESLNLLQRVIDRLRQLALMPASAEGTNSGLPTWFNDMIHRLPPQVRGSQQLAALIAEGLALTDTWLREERILPEGVSEQQYREQLQVAEHRLGAGLPLNLDVGLQGSTLVLKSPGESLRPWWPLGQIQAVARKHLTVSVESNTGERQLVSRMLENGSDERIPLPPDARAVCLETPASRLQLHKISRPTWAQRFWQDQWGLAAEFRIGNVPFVMRWIPPGRFLMGSPEGENGRYSDEGPQHEVTISQGYWLGQTPVTQQQWVAVVQAAEKSDLKPKPSRFAGKPVHPVESVTWHNCVAFCQLVQGQLGCDLTFRLPSEAQWEYACRAGTTGAYHDGSACTQPEGNDPALDRLGWFSKNSGGSTQPVGLKLCNNWGLYDMHGNVWEWCRDTMRGYRAEASVDPLGPETSGASRVLRGGGWSSIAGGCRAAYRYANGPGVVWDYHGLRLSAGPSGFSGGAGDL